MKVVTIGVSLEEAATVLNLEEEDTIVAAYETPIELVAHMCHEIDDAILVASKHIAAAHLVILAQPVGEVRPVLCEFGGPGRIRRVA